MALPNKPGQSYLGMYHLIASNRVQMYKEVFSPELIIGICWEETFFNNIKQEVGTGVGFGQTEPAEFWKLENDVARARGYYVSGLPRRNTIIASDGSKIVSLAGALDDGQAILVLTALMVQLYIDLKFSSRAVLEGLAGVAFSRKIAKEVAEGKMTVAAAKSIDPLGVSGRLGKITGWLSCENILLNQLPDNADTRPKIREALAASRGFPRTDPEWNRILFGTDEKVWTG